MPISDGLWQDPALDCICAEMRTASRTPFYDATETAVFAVFNAGDAVTVTLPDAPRGTAWNCAINTADPAQAPVRAGREFEVAAHSVAVLVLDTGA